MWTGRFNTAVMLLNKEVDGVENKGRRRRKSTDGRMRRRIRRRMKKRI
jgi:hypothetical protein